MNFKTSMTAAASVAAGAVLTIAIAAFAQSSAASDSTTRPIPTQTCVQAMATEMGSHLANFDTENAKRKTLMQTQLAALAAAANITDDTARGEALTKAREDFHAAMKADMEAHKAEREASMAAIKTACGDSFRHGFGMGMMKGPGFFGGPGHGKGFGPHDRHHDDDGDGDGETNDDANANTQTQNQ